MPLPMIVIGKYLGRDEMGIVRFDLTIRIPDVPEGIAFVRGICEQDFLSGRELPTEFHAFGQPDYKIKLGPSIQQVRRSVTNQERRTAEALGGHRQSGSGARPGYKGDGRVEGKFRIENKMTTAGSIRVALKDLTKVRSECAPGEQPVFEVEFRDKGTLRVKEKWALVPWKEWEKRVNATNDDR